MCISNFFIHWELSRNLANPDLAAHTHLVQPGDKTGHRMSQTLTHGEPLVELNNVLCTRLCTWQGKFFYWTHFDKIHESFQSSFL